MTDVQKLNLVATMLHELPRGRQRDDDDSGMVFSNQPTPLDVQTDRFIREEMLDPYVMSGREIVDAQAGSSPVPTLVREIIADGALLPAHSRNIADWMHKTQGGGSSAGVFLAATAVSAGLDRFVIMKAEHQEGVRLNHSGAGDDVVFEVQHLTELIMGQNSQVYKIAVMWIDPNSDLLVGRMVDKQNGVGYADFFLSEFLGCELTHQAEVLTQRFVKGLGKFLNSPTLNEEKKLRYAAAIVSVLESPASKLKPTQFLRDFIEREDRDLAAEFIGAQIASMEFRKDVTLVRGQIGGLKVHTTSDVTISASSDAMNDGTIKLEPDSPEGPRIIVKGAPDGYQLSSKPKK
ncbi:nucleoid-associated protein [Rhodoglobus sp. NPDC076762]